MKVRTWFVIAVVFAIPISVAGQTPAARPTGPRSFDVRDFGAVGDGKSPDTGAIQRAIDACVQQGGGIVVVDHGNYLTGTIQLRSHVELHLTSTATLLGVGDLAKYRRDPKEVYKLLDRSLVYAEGCDQIAITGQGTINGQGKQFKNGNRDLRPVLIRLRDCTNVRLEGVLVKSAASFAVHPIHCRQVRIEGLRIENRAQPNNDGIDIDGCQDVLISNCNISSIDDSIALKTIEPGQPCRDVVVTNCILSSDCAAIRVGPDAVTPIERVCVSNCVIRDTHLNGIKIQESFGSVMRDMVFSNIVMDNVTGPISIRLAGWKLGAGNVWAVFDDSNWEKGQLRNILFQNIRARVPADNIKSCISITGAGAARPREITFSNLDVSFPGGGTAVEAARRIVPDLERDYPECYIFGVLPAYAFYVHHADRITLDNVRFQLEAKDLRPAIVCDDVEEFDVAGLKAEGNPRAESLLRMQNAREVYVRGARVLTPIGTFLQVEGDKTRRIVVKGNNLSLVGKVVSRGRRAS